ncbi:hypothetical protein [Streptomyces sp. CHB9.2]|uniref:hypothetical protein n=1 Tax=Streptomyces sp. CHB9.2 TaxID=2841670 RepID=UPI0020941D7D|nr:hypothetical protein [Streptomyces sp. CHB9.2]MCO6704833.1 hypothetical protein [Streptomyces sp. CHB9.2]
MAATYTYPFDPTGSATTNAVANERHVLSPPAWTDFYFIVPKYAPYFRDSLRVIHRPSGKLLVEGQDYHCTHYFHAASHGVARRVYGSITFLDKTLTGVAEISYQTIGGDWILDASADLTRLTNTQLNPRITTWEQVVDVPYQFPPIDHEWNLEDLKGVEAILPILEEMTEAIRESAGSDFALHVNDKNNPHNVTKGQVGLDQVQNFPLANITEAQQATLNTRYMTPVRTKNFVDFYVVPLLDAHKNDLNNPHGTTKAQVGLGSVQNYGVATQAEAEAGVVANKYMTPLQTKQAIEALANSGLTDHIADKANPHGTTKAQVGLGSVENLPLATVAEAQAASRNDRYMTPLTTAAAINTLVGESLTLHINATNNPHFVTKNQVGLGNVQNYGIATDADSAAGTRNDLYMTPLQTKKAIESLATGSIASHLADDQNPHATTKAQVGLGSVQNFPIANLTEAQLGESNARYMTPLMTAAAIEARVGDTGVTTHISDYNNPHRVTAAQVGAPTTAAMNTALLSKLDSTAQAADSKLLEGQTVAQIIAAAGGVKAPDSAKLDGKTYAEVLAAAQAQKAADSSKLEGKTLAEVIAAANSGVADQDVAVQYSFPEIPSGATNWLQIARTNFLPTDEPQDLVLLIAGGGRTDGTAEAHPTFLVRMGYGGDAIEVTMMSPGALPTFELYRQPLAGGFGALWVKTAVGCYPLNVTVLSGKGNIVYDTAVDPTTTAPTGAVKATILLRADQREGNTKVIHEQVSVAAGAWKEYALKTYIDTAVHNVPGTEIRVRILDQVAGSPTLNQLIDAEALVTTAIDLTTAAPKARIYNASSTALTLNIRVEVPRT